MNSMKGRASPSSGLIVPGRKVVDEALALDIGHALRSSLART